MFTNLWKAYPFHGPPTCRKRVVKLLPLTGNVRTVLVGERVEDGLSVQLSRLVLSLEYEARCFRVEDLLHATVRRNQLIPDVAGGWEKNVAGIVSKKGNDPDAIPLRRGN